MITIRELLTHTAGLPAWRPVYLLAEDEPERAAGAIANLDLEYKPGTRVVYSDLGFIALGILLSRLTGHSLADMARTEIFAPLEPPANVLQPRRGITDRHRSLRNRQRLRARHVRAERRGCVSEFSSTIDLGRGARRQRVLPRRRCGPRRTLPRVRPTRSGWPNSSLPTTC